MTELWTLLYVERQCGRFVLVLVCRHLRLVFICLSVTFPPSHDPTRRNQKAFAWQIKNFLEHQEFQKLLPVIPRHFSFATAWSNAKYDVVLSALCSALLRLKMKKLLMPSTFFILKYATMSGDFFLPLQNWWSCYISINWRRKLLYFPNIVWIVLKLCTESVVVNHSWSVHVVVDLSLCVCFVLFLNSSNAYPRLYPHITWCEPLGLIWHGPTGFQSSDSLSPTILQHSTCQSMTDWLTNIDLWSQNGILIRHLAAFGLLMHSLSLTNMHTLTHCPPVCERDSVVPESLFFFL